MISPSGAFASFLSDGSAGDGTATSVDVPAFDQRVAKQRARRNSCLAERVDANRTAMDEER
jgi:hypothetical protein